MITTSGKYNSHINIPIYTVCVASMNVCAVIVIFRCSCNFDRDAISKTTETQILAF